MDLGIHAVRSGRQPSAKIAVGVAGWSYPDWRDTVYRLPSTQPDLFGSSTGSAPGAGRNEHAGHVHDELEFILQYVDMIEINSTFYRIPSPGAAASWRRKALNRPGVFFTAKVHRDITHEFQRDSALAARFRSGLEPLQTAGLLPALLAQFRYDFKDGEDARRHLLWIHEQFAEFAHLVIEVRHVSWESPDAVQFLRDLGVTVANLDYPTGRTSFNRYCCVTHPFGYLRLHGRNREAWFRKAAAPHEPYDYDYSDQEIAEIAERARMLGRRVRQLVIVANNHYRGKSLSAALRLKAVLQRSKTPVPPALLETYPGLRPYALNAAAGADSADSRES